MLTGKQGLRPSVKCWTSTPNHRLGITDLKYAKSVDNILDVMLFLYRDSSYHACRLNVYSCAILFLTIYSAKEIAVYAQL
jgi:hypothetical protein